MTQSGVRWKGSTHRMLWRTANNLANGSEVEKCFGVDPVGRWSQKIIRRLGVLRAALRAAADLVPRLLVTAAGLAFLFCPCGNTKIHLALRFCLPLSKKSVAVGKGSNCQIQHPSAVSSSSLCCTLFDRHGLRLAYPCNARPSEPRTKQAPLRQPTSSFVLPHVSAPQPPSLMSFSSSHLLPASS